MTREPRILRSFFVEQRVDQLISRISLEGDVSKNEVFRFLLEAGMRPFAQGEVPFETLGAQAGSEEGEREDAEKVLRSIYVDRELDDYMRHTAFTHRVSKGELMRRYIDRALNDIRTDLNALAASSASDKPTQQASLASAASSARRNSPVPSRELPRAEVTRPSTTVSSVEKVALAVASAVREH